MTPLNVSLHARTRNQQRGITVGQIEAVEKYADRAARRGRGTASLWISRRKLRQFGPTTPEGISTDRLHGLIVLLGADRTCVTAFRNRRTSTYRRSMRF